MSAAATNLRSSKERNLFVIALIFSSLVWVGVVVSLVGLMYAAFIGLALVIGHAFFLARVTGNSIRVGSRQLPDLYKKVESAASRLGMQQVPEVYVTSGGGILNAFATKLFSRNFVILNSEILDACEALDERREGEEAKSAGAVDFIIGHELGHLALGHLAWNWLLWPAKIVPLLGAAYSRACEYSSDACGLAVVDDVETASRALAVLSAGGKQARKISLDALVEQRHETGGFVMALVELNSSHPYLSKRVAAVARAKNDGLPDVGRNPLAYVMAPFFGFAAGGGAAALFTVYMYVAVVGILAAIAIPNFMKFQERSKLAALGGQPSAFDRISDSDAQLEKFDAPPPKTLEEIMAELNEVPAPAHVADALPPNDDDAAGPRFEARAWLKGQLAAKNKEAVAGLPTTKAVALVDKLYKAGAPRVWVAGVDVDDEGVFANEIAADMPSKPALRKKLITICTGEYKKLGYTDPCEDEGADVTTAVYFNWQE